MTQTPEVIRIAIIVEREGAGCLSLALPFSVIGYPLVQIEFFKGGTPSGPRLPGKPPLDIQPEAVAIGLVKDEAAMPVKPLAELAPEAFDLVVDWQNWTGELANLPQEGLPHVVTGPGTPFLEKILCQYQEIRQKQEVNAGILVNAADAIVTIDENHTIIAYNYGAEKIFGYPRKEALGQDLSIVIPTPYKAEHKGYVRRYVATRQARVIGKHIQLNALRRDGTEFPISISFSVAEIQGHLYFTGIVRDISESKEMEQRLLRSERLAAIGNTVSHIAHEIKNPLAIIGGFARQLQKTAGLKDKAQQKLGIITEEVARLEGMISEMRDFVRLPPVQKRPGELEALLDEVLEFFRDTFQEHRVTVRRVQEGDLPRVTFDPQQLRQVLVNLVKNALEAMPRGGELSVATRVQDGNMEISLSDTGEGMAPEVAANVFEPYFTTKEKGTGLGLAICQNIVQEHGGCIIADSTPGEGSTFTIQLPLEEAPQE